MRYLFAWMMMALLLGSLAACANDISVGDENQQSESASFSDRPARIRYRSMIDGAVVILDLSKNQLVLPAQFDAMAWPLSLCQNDEKYICVDSDFLEFSFPRCLEDGMRSWIVEGRHYELTRTLADSEDVGPLYLVRAYKNDQLKNVFLFNYRYGLIFVGYMESQKSTDFDVDIDVAHGLYVPEGKGFGASVNGPECP